MRFLLGADTGEVALKDKQESSRREDSVSEGAACTEAEETQGLSGAMKGKSTCYLGERQCHIEVT